MKTIKGDLLNIESGTILHQVNCMGVTGGLAGALRQKFPDHFEDYLALCEMNDPVSLLGDFTIECAGDESVSIAHIFGQLRPGPNTNMVAVESALGKLLKWKSAGKDTGPIYAPYKMGCGLGGGNWSDYEKLLVKHFPEIIIVNNER